MSTNYRNLIQQFGKQQIVVIGELMLDAYLLGTSNRICREAPVPIVNVQSRENSPGGAANVAINLAVMGAQTTFLSVTGKDQEGRAVADLLEQTGVCTDHIVYDANRATLTKQRILSDGQLLVRYDYGTTAPLSGQAEKQLIKRLTALYRKADAILVSDYGYGIITDTIIAAIQSLQQKTPKLLIVDSKNLARFRDLHPTAVKPNYQEALQLLKLPKATPGERVDQMLAHGQDILAITGASIAAVTVDSEGAVIFEQGKTPYRTYTKAVPGSKTIGAGDTYVSAFAIALSLGVTPLTAAEVAAAAASVVVHKDGTATCSSDELIGFFTPPQKVIGDRQELAARVHSYREQGRKIIFTNGCFDILHRGHITYLAQAKALGDILIVGVNSDESVKLLKGPDRPINSLEDRMHILAALDCVDHVVSFGEKTPIDLIQIVKPDVYVKGGDYTKASLPEAPIVEKLGGTVEILPYIKDRSTTAVINKINGANQTAQAANV